MKMNFNLKLNVFVYSFRYLWDGSDRGFNPSLKPPPGV